jgi:choline-sulfatase
VDLFPTLLESGGVSLHQEDNDLPGTSLWPAMTGSDRKRTAFAEYHANFSKSGSFMLRDGAMKLIYHVGMPAQLFDLDSDPQEITDLMIENPHAYRATAAALESQLRRICDPEEINRRAKADQRRLAEHYGGPGKILDFGSITFTPSPQHH